MNHRDYCDKVRSYYKVLKDEKPNKLVCNACGEIFTVDTHQFKPAHDHLRDDHYDTHKEWIQNSPPKRQSRSPSKSPSKVSAKRIRHSDSFFPGSDIADAGVSSQKTADQLSALSSSQATSLIRHNYTDEVEAALNKQINIELYASYVYLSMAAYFDRDDVALHNIAEWLKKQSNNEREHGIAFIKFQNTRGGRVILKPIEKPENDEWGTALDAFQAALALEKFNNQSLLELNACASRNNDDKTTEFLEFHIERSKNFFAKIESVVKHFEKGGANVGVEFYHVISK